MKNKNLTAFLLACLTSAYVITPVSAQNRATSPSSGGSSSAVTQLKQVAYIKASNPHASDHFGNGGALEGHGLALSGDGNTMAVGAPYESSAAKGINGDQNDTSLYGSGAVYIFIRVNNAWTQQAYIKASNPGQSYRFGHVVSLSQDGNTLAVLGYWGVPARQKGSMATSMISPSRRPGRLMSSPARARPGRSRLTSRLQTRVKPESEISWERAISSRLLPCAECRRQYAGRGRHLRGQRRQKH